MPATNAIPAILCRRIISHPHIRAPAVTLRAPRRTRVESYTTAEKATDVPESESTPASSLPARAGRLMVAEVYTTAPDGRRVPEFGDTRTGCVRRTRMARQGAA